MAAPKKEDVRSEGTEDVLTLSARQQLTSFHLVGKRGEKKAKVIKEMVHFGMTAPNQFNTIS